jgi:hypothetical protein
MLDTVKSPQVKKTQRKESHIFSKNGNKNANFSTVNVSLPYFYFIFSTLI